MEGHDQFNGRADPFLWKGKTTFMEGQDHFHGRAGPYLWKGRMGLNSDLANEKSLIPGMFTITHDFVPLRLFYNYNYN